MACLLFGLAHLTQIALGSEAPAPKRVLVVHSFVNAAPPFTTHSIAFETELTEKFGERVDLDEISLDMARYADIEMQEALVAYLQKRQAKWQPDLVVPIGSPAGIFVADYRDRLFPNTPVLYTGMDQRRLPPGALQKNAAFIGEDFHVPGFVEDILEVAPATTNIVVVLGASALERFWGETFRREFASFTNRVSFVWLNDLSLDQMLDRVSRLPPRSFIFLVLLLRDASGVTHNADEALKRIHAVANAPVNGIFQNQLGLGIVGGRLYQAELEGVESARTAIRILRGERASNFPPKLIGPLPPRYDWRELQRWKIKENLLPDGSTILFREPSVWQRYSAWIIGGVTVVALQAILIFGLLANLAKRRRAERSLSESENRFRIAADEAPVMIWMSDKTKGCTFFNKPWLDFTGRTTEQEAGDGWAQGVCGDDLQRCLKTYTEAFDARQPFVMEYRLRRWDGEYRWVSDSGTPRHDAQGQFAGYIGSCLDVTEARRKFVALAESEERLRAILNTAIEAIVTISPGGLIESINRATQLIFGYSEGELIGKDISLLLPPTEASNSERSNEKSRSTPFSALKGGREVNGRRKNGELFPIDLLVNELALGSRTALTFFIRDISERRTAERVARDLTRRLIHAQEAERARLARELHDDITQRLARLAIDAGRAEANQNGAAGGEMMRDVRDGLIRLSEDVHALSYKLHPAVLEDLGLTDALKVECERFAQSESIPVESELETIPRKIPLDAGLCLFRVTQEALRNVARHARAQTAAVSLRSLDGGLQLAITDCGIGFDLAKHRHHPSLGLASMRERVHQLGGVLDIESAPGQGTSIVAWVPLTRDVSC